MGAIELTYKAPDGRPENRLLYRHDEAELEVVKSGRLWSFDGDGSMFRLVSEAQRIQLAHLYDPVLAVHTSLVEPLPHQITAVYEAMLLIPGSTAQKILCCGFHTGSTYRFKVVIFYP